MSLIALIIVLGLIIALFWIFPNMPVVLQRCLYVVAVVAVVVWVLDVTDVWPVLHSPRHTVEVPSRVEIR